MLENLGQRIKSARQKKKLTQADLAKIINVSTATVGQYEVNSSKPSVHVLLKISDACEVNTDWLLKGVSTKNFDQPKDQGVFEKLIDENEQLKQQVRALTRAINLMPEYTGKDEVIDQQAGEFQDRPPILHQPDTMTKQLDEAA